MLRIFLLFKMAHRDNDRSFFLKWGTETLKLVFFFKMADGDNDTCSFFSRWHTETMT
jgi:hypothetical protein